MLLYWVPPVDNVYIIIVVAIITVSKERRPTTDVGESDCVSSSKLRTYIFSQRSLRTVFGVTENWIVHSSTYHESTTYCRRILLPVLYRRSG